MTHSEPGGVGLAQPTIAFLFDESAPEFNRSEVDPRAACLDAVLSVPLESVSTHVRVGSILFFPLASRVTEVSFEGAAGKRLRSTSHTMSVDRNRLTAIVWDLLDNVEQQWSTVDVGHLTTILVTSQLYCVVLSSLDRTTAGEADVALREAPGYVGALQVDLGNPVQVQLFYEQLIESAVIAAGSIIVASEDDEEAIVPHWANEIGGRTVRAAPTYALDAELPPLELPSSLSVSGQRTVDLLRGIPGDTLQKRVMETISRREVLQEEEFDSLTISTSEAPQLLQAEISEGKLCEYVLSPTHPVGKHKAYLFKTLLDIERDDWRYLAAQLLRGLGEAEIHRVRLAGHGVKYSADIPVRGRNGVTKIVATGWISFNDQPPRLTSAMIADADLSPVDPGRVVPVVRPGTQDEDRFRLIYAAAVEAAEENARNVAAVPMKIDGYSLIRDGACGFAGVRVVDGRSSFVRWLRKNGIGRRHHRKGWYIDAATDSQSVDRKRGYAEGFASVLALNGIACEVESRLD